MKNQSYQNKKGYFTTQQLVLVALFIALHLAFGNLPKIKTPLFEMGWGFIATTLSAAICGPLPTLFISVFADLLDIFLLRGGTNFFIGFTLSAGLAGIIYAVGLYRQQWTLRRVFLTVLVVTLIPNVLLNTLWVHILYGKAIMVLLPVRISKNLISLVVNTAVLYYLLNNEHIKRLIVRYQFPKFNLKK